jgi:hypothetical protein
MSSHSTHEIITKETKQIPITIVHGDTTSSQSNLSNVTTPLVQITTPIQQIQHRTIPITAKCCVCSRNNVSLDFVPKRYVKHHNVEIPDNVERIWSCFSCSH